MSKIKYGIVGASGKMGKEIIAIMNENGNELVFKYDLDGEWENDSPQILIDFSLPQVFEKSIDYGIKFKSPFIIGTTGLSDAQMNKLKEISKQIPVVQSYNFSVGVQLLLECVQLLNKKLTDWDVEVVETHHRFKKDKPSGTALMVKNVLGKDRPTGKAGINISSLRLGNVVGEHSVSFGGLGETLTITHNAISRRTFAEGVLRAVNFILDKQNGFYTIKDVLSS